MSRSRGSRKGRGRRDGATARFLGLPWWLGVGALAAVLSVIVVVAAAWGSDTPSTGRIQNKGSNDCIIQGGSRNTCQSNSGSAGSAGSPIVGMSGGCAPFAVYAQNRWRPIGTAIRAAPNAGSEQLGSFPANMIMHVNGWVHGRPPYPSNTYPWNSDIWFHLADGAGWVSFAGVRALPTVFDPTGLSKDGGPAAATAVSCEGAIQ